MIYSALIRYVFMAAQRDRLIISLVVMLLLGASLSVFLGSGAVTEKDYFSIVFAASGLRIVGVMGLVLFAVFFIRRSFDSRDIEYLLSRPVNRISFLLSYACAFSILAIILGLAQGLCLFIIGPHLFGVGHFYWLASIIVENIIMINTALFFSMYLKSAATSAMSTLGFYVLARMMGQILGIIDKGPKLQNFEVLEYVMQIISTITPRLDLLGQTAWLLYDGAMMNIGLGFIFIQGAVFTFLVLIAAMIDLTRRQF